MAVLRMTAQNAVEGGEQEHQHGNGRSFGAPVLRLCLAHFLRTQRLREASTGCPNVPRRCIGPAIALPWSVPQSLLGVAGKTVVYVGWLALLTSYAGFTVL